LVNEYSLIKGLSDLEGKRIMNLQDDHVFIDQGGTLYETV